MTAISMFNTLLAVGMFFACVDLIKRMTRRTDCAVRWAGLMILGGAIGQAAAYIIGDWYYYADSMLWGGVLAYLVAEKRGATEGWANETRMFIPSWWVGLPRVTRSPATWLQFSRTFARLNALEVRTHPRRWASYAVTAGTLAAMLASGLLR